MGLIDVWVQGIRRFRMIFLATLLTPTLLAAVLSLLLPKAYKAQSVLIPVNSRLGDKGRFTGDEIAELYSLFGSGDDLDRLHEAALSEDVYRSLVDSLGLVRHYVIRPDAPAAAEKAKKRLQTLTDVRKTENGALQVRAWDKDPAIALAIVQGITSSLDRTYRELHRTYYQGIVASVSRSLATMMDSTDEETQQLYRKSLTEARIALDNPPPVFAEIEHPVLAVKADRPRVWFNTLLAAALSFLLASGLVLWLSRTSQGHP